MIPGRRRSPWSEAAAATWRWLRPWAPDDQGGRLARALLPVAVMLPIGLAALRLAGQRAGLYGTETGLALLTAATVGVLFTLISITARTLSAIDARRIEMEQALRRMNAELEERVAHRKARFETVTQELETILHAAADNLRAPLHALEGLVSVLLQDHAQRLDEDGRRVVGMIHTEVRRTGQLVEELLPLARIGSQPLNVTALDMTALAREVFESLAPLERMRRARLTLDALPQVQGDATMLRQVWVSLLVNAVRFVPPDGIPLITVGSSSDGRRHTYFVRDNGVGLDARAADRLFEPFQPLRGGTELPGSGVGLALVQRIVTHHGGSVRAEGEIDRGATVYFTLPARPEEPPA